MIDEPPISRREKRILERKQQIMIAAAHLIAKKGFANTTTKDIAETAEIAEGTIYNYFDSKDDILLELVNHLAKLEDRAQQLEEAMQEGDYYTTFVENTRQRIENVRPIYNVYLAILPEILSTPDLRNRYYQQLVVPINGMLEQFLQAGITKGHFRQQDVPLVARLINAMVMGFQVLHILGDEEMMKAWEDSQHFAEVLIQLLYDGITVKK